MPILSALPPSVRAALWMVGTLLSFTFMAVGGRELSDTMSAFEVSFFRAAGGFVLVLALLWRTGFAQVRTQRLPLHFTRNIFHFIGQTLWFLSLGLLPLATVFALEFTIPFWTAFFAMIFLGEKLNRGRLVAIVLGFVGVLIIVQPGSELFNPAAVIVLIAAIGFSVSNVCTKPLSSTDSPFAIIFFMNLIQMPLGLIAASFHWVWPSLNDIPWIVIVGVAGLSAHFCMTRAFMLADAIVVMPIDYLRLPLAVAIGYFVYHESVGWALVLGAAIIFAGNIYALRYEAQRRPSA
jgi:drug/metabolite transporter (DMT)-like permease